MFPLFSIIIAAKRNNKFLQECIEKCLKLDYPFFEILILPDENMYIDADPKIKVIPTGNILPAAKRDIGAAQAQGQILAFLDDDAYPDANWLKQAALNFNDEDIACVCGPAITAKEEPLKNQASGRLYESIIVSGPARFRYLPLKKCFTDDYPSCNFFIKRDDFLKLGGFKTKFWPGEDTILCLEVVSEINKKILYDPQVLVYHHRRPLFKSHLKQIANYALHRGYFVKRFPKTSLKLGYFLPSILILILLFSISGGIFLNSELFYFVFFYLMVVFVFGLTLNLELFFYIFTGIVLTHLVYGVFFLRGLFSNKLKEE